MEFRIEDKQAFNLVGVSKRVPMQFQGVNNEIVNLENCEQEPIHIPGSIQPHGFLLGLTENGLKIDYCSANTAEYITMLYG